MNVSCRAKGILCSIASLAYQACCKPFQRSHAPQRNHECERHCICILHADFSTSSLPKAPTQKTSRWHGKYISFCREAAYLSKQSHKNPRIQNRNEGQRCLLDVFTVVIIRYKILPSAPIHSNKLHRPSRSALHLPDPGMRTNVHLRICLPHAGAQR